MLEKQLQNLSRLKVHAFSMTTWHFHLNYTLKVVFSYSKQFNNIRKNRAHRKKQEKRKSAKN